MADKCNVCESNTWKYKCICTVVKYCSIACFKKHKEICVSYAKPEKQEGQNNSSNTPSTLEATNATTNTETTNTETTTNQETTSNQETAKTKTETETANTKTETETPSVVSSLSTPPINSISSIINNNSNNNNNNNNTPNPIPLITPSIVSAIPSASTHTEEEDRNPETPKLISYESLQKLGESSELIEMLQSNHDLREILLEIDRANDSPQILSKYLAKSPDFNKFSDLVLQIISLRNQDNEFVG